MNAACELVAVVFREICNTQEVSLWERAALKPLPVLRTAKNGKCTRLPGEKVQITVY